IASGVTGKLLHIDLTTRQTRTEELPEAVMRKFLGGGALASYLLLRDMPPGVDPLGPDNVLVLATSVINGLSLSGTNRYTAAAKSPLTGGYGESEAGGWWGPELRAAGWDGLVIRGKAASPVYLWIKDDKVEFRDASRYWGQLSGEVQDGIEQELGDKRVRVLQTGVSGERGVRFAAIVNQLKHFHGRSGLGAVMGAKNLKAVVVRGSKPPVAGDKEKAKSQLVWFKEHYDRATDRFHQVGSAGGVLALEASGILPTRNFRDGSFEHAKAISGQTMRDTILVNRGTCYACAVACKREVEVKELGVTPKYGGPEYETLAASGSLCGVGDLKALALINQLYAQYVLDSISTGAAIAFAMECYEHGIITKEMTGGLELTWGNADAVIQLTHMIGKREGIGELLGEGVKPPPSWARARSASPFTSRARSCPCTTRGARRACPSRMPCLPRAPTTWKRPTIPSTPASTRRDIPSASSASSSRSTRSCSTPRRCARSSRRRRCGAPTTRWACATSWARPSMASSSSPWSTTSTPSPAGT